MMHMCALAWCYGYDYGSPGFLVIMGMEIGYGYETLLCGYGYWFGYVHVCPVMHMCALARYGCAVCAALLRG